MGRPVLPLVCRIRATSNVFAAASLTGSPFSMCRKLAAWLNDGSGGIGSRPPRRRWYRATMVGILGVEGAKARLALLVAEAASALAPFGDAAAILIDAARFVAEREA